MATPKKLRKNELISSHNLAAAFPQYRRSNSKKGLEEPSYRKSKTSRLLTKQLSTISIDESETDESISINQSIQISTMVSKYIYQMPESPNKFNIDDLD